MHIKELDWVFDQKQPQKSTGLAGNSQQSSQEPFSNLNQRCIVELAAIIKCTSLKSVTLNVQLYNEIINIVSRLPRVTTKSLGDAINA